MNNGLTGDMMSKLFEASRKSAGGEVVNAFKFAFENQKNIIASLFWVIVVSAVSSALFWYGFMEYIAPHLVALKGIFNNVLAAMKSLITATAGSGMSPAEYLKAHPDFLDRYLSGIALSAPDPEILTQAALSFMKYVFVGFFLTIMSVLMMYVKYYRFMILGEGQEAPVIPAFSFGKKEMSIVGWGIVLFFVELLMQTALGVVIVIVAAILGAGQGKEVINLLSQVGTITILIIMMRFAFVIPAAVCGHGGDLARSWRQMRGRFVSFIWAHFLFAIMSILVALVAWGVPGYLVYLNWSAISSMADSFVLLGLMLVIAFVYLTWVGIILGAAQIALKSRYYGMALGEVKDER